MRKLLLVLIIVCLYSMAIGAEPVGRQRAQQIAAQFLSKISISHRAPSASEMQAEAVFDEKNGMGMPYLYVVHASEDKGFVIVSGDDRFAEVLGYSDSGSFDENLLPDNMKAWLQGYIEEMKELDARGYAPMMTSRRAATSWPVIKPMTTTKWFQGAPYNDLLPTDEVIGHYLAGCMTIATAQLVNYWAQKTGKPAKTMKPVPAYTTETLKIAIEELPVTEFDWTKMRNAYDETSVEADKAEVAKLIKYCAYANQSDFTPLVTGGRSLTIPETLIEYFGFDKTANLQLHELYSHDDWTAMIYNELKNQRPVIYGASTTGISTAGHAFIIDGYDGDEMFHINFGWGGKSDGYYKLSVMDYHNKDNKDAPVSPSSFTTGQAAVFGAQTGVSTPAEMLFSTLAWSVMVTDNSITANYTNIMGMLNTFEIGLAYLDENGTLETIVTREEEIPAEKQYNTLNGITEEQLLWDLLMEHFDGNEIATLGVMCNLKSESRFAAGNLEDYNNQIWEIEDHEYTEKINRHTIDKQDFLEARLLDTTNGFYNKYGEWVNIDGGYGYGQYTSYAKKEGLYHFAEVWFGPGGPGEEYKFNIADPEMQAHYVLSILESDEFKSMDKQIRSSKKVVDACYLWLKMYEIPQDPYCDNYFTLSFERASSADAIREACLNRESVSDNEAEPETVNGTNLDLGDSTSGAGLNN